MALPISRIDELPCINILILYVKWQRIISIYFYFVVFTEMHQYLFGVFLYQFHNMVLCCSTYITVMLALERYKAVWRPVEYRNSVLSGNPWQRVFVYVAPVVLLSVLFNVPKVRRIRWTLSAFCASRLESTNMQCFNKLRQHQISILWQVSL